MAQSKVCSIDGCSKPVIARGWCTKHYKRWASHGNPMTTTRAAHGILNEWIDRHLNYDGVTCLMWPFGRSDGGYAHVWREGKYLSVHRILCEYKNGKPHSPNLDAAHSCGNGKRGCVSPSHLRWATRKINEADKLKHGTSPRGENNGHAKLNASQVCAIRAAVGISHIELAAQYNISRSSVGLIRARKNWAWLE